MAGAIRPYVHVEHHDEIAVLLVDNPPVNALSPGVPEAIIAALDLLNQDQTVRAIVLAGAGRTFMAGADIREFQQENPQAYLEHLCRCALAVEDSPKPVVMAIHGTAFGAGLETALAGHYRVMAAAAQLGQPEIKLGLIPGAGGTQRLPRLAGVEKALEMCAFGEPITAADAQAHGIVDLVLDGELLAGAIGFAREVAGRAPNTPLQKTRHRRARTDSTGIWEHWLAKARSRLPGQTAPLAAIRAIAAATRLTFSDGMATERELFLECWRSTQAKALVYLFFAQRAAAKPPEAPAVVQPEKQNQENRHDEPRIIVPTSSAVELHADGIICVDHSSGYAANSHNFTEIVCGPEAGTDRVRKTMEWARRRGKSVVVVRGFVGHRLAQRYQQELAALGISNEQAQQALLSEEARNASVVQRLIAALAEEGASILQEGLVTRASDIDVILTLGYGFPAWRGGPMFAQAHASHHSSL